MWLGAVEAVLQIAGKASQEMLTSNFGRSCFFLGKPGYIIIDPPCLILRYFDEFFYLERIHKIKTGSPGTSPQVVPICQFDEELDIPSQATRLDAWN